MDDDLPYDRAVDVLETLVDQACNRVLGPLTGEEIAQELRRIADQWEGESK